ncbi:MAG: erythronate-4-phosphate dehydrogenase [Gammaproteobacteria bacterium]|nr:MAG: erythronate-4-phosphate dehydrogenase [Gammaproteobacteria bacterium]
MQSIRTSKALTIVADANISHLGDYFNLQILGVDVTVIKVAGREITHELLTSVKPQALLVRSVTFVNESLLVGQDSVQYVGSATIGTDHIDQAYLNQKNIGFANASGCSKHSVAQYVLTSILTLRPQYWQKPITLGIIGLGNIGSTLAHYANDLGWQVLGYDPFLESTQRNHKNNNASFKQLLQHSDVISLHVPLTTSQQSKYPTYHLIDENALTMMKTDTLLVNSSRGKVVSEQALLAEQPDSKRQVVLDVFEHEPFISTHLLDKLAVVTPHIAGYSVEGKLRGTQMIYEAFCKHFNLPINQKIQNLLPANQYNWADLKKMPDRLVDYYNIMQDDADLRNVLNQISKQVDGKDFDELRKKYELRREWTF